MDPTKAFVFGPGIDMDGVSHVGSGHDDDPFILGVTSPHLLDSIIRHTSRSQFILMHADATFKLSDVAYPVITIGFSDASRSHRLAALFVVSQRTRRDYRIFFQELVNVIRRHRGVTIRVDAIMGDAEDAQLLGFQDVPEFANVTPLMCFFHVLYNVRKRISHQPVELRKVAMRSIIDMHFTESMEDFVRCRTAELKRWQQLPGLWSFTDYFIQQWLSGRFWRWQVFHTPPAYATTNNPCEVFNATIKKHTQRRRLPMTTLIGSMCDLVASQTPLAPVGAEFRPPPNADIVNVSKRMVSSGRATLRHSQDRWCVFVRYVGSRGDEDQTSDDHAYTETFKKRTELAQKIVRGNNEGEKADAKKKKASEMYNRANRWSLWRAHSFDSPVDGCRVHITTRQCGCRYYNKFLVCANVLIAVNARDLSALGKMPRLHDKSRRPAKGSGVTTTQQTSTSAVVSINQASFAVTDHRAHTEVE